MRRKTLCCGMCTIAFVIALAGFSMKAECKNGRTMLPAAGFASVSGEGTPYEELQNEVDTVVAKNVKTAKKDLKVKDLNSIKINSEVASEDNSNLTKISDSAATVIKADGVSTSSANVNNITIDDQSDNAEASETTEETEETVLLDDKALEDLYFSNLVIADVNDYVNVRAENNTESEILGKLYDNSVGELIEEKDGWYKIKSGNVEGYVSAEFCVTGDAAVEMAREVGTRIATVNTTTLKVREEASTESAVLGLVPIEEELVVTEETEGWVKVSIEEGDGYVSDEYVTLRTDFVKAESKEEEKARLAKEKEEREAARRAAAAARPAATTPATPSGTTATVPVVTSDNEMGAAVANYALQFVGNPYVYGGSSLTEGTDCSGFVMSVYANYGVSLPHSSTSDRTQGYAVDSLENAQPGDLICYSGHVALYIGNGQIVHASTKKTGIIVSTASYKKILAIRRIF